MFLLDSICCSKRPAVDTVAERSKAAAKKNQVLALIAANKEAGREENQEEPEQRMLPAKTYAGPRQERTAPHRSAAGGVLTSQRSESLNISTTDSEKKARQCVEMAQQYAESLKVKCLKYPKGGKNVLNRPHTRFLVVEPAEVENSGTDPWSGRLQGWGAGQLLYWKDAQSYMEKEKPKGVVKLMSIVKVSWDPRESPEEVVIRHVEEQERSEMVLKFSNRRVAEDWSSALTELRKLLQAHFVR